MADLQTSTFSLLSPKDKVRLWGKVDVRGPDECWLWKGTITPNGYGQFGLGHARKVSAHRVVYFLAYGEDPGSLFVCHTCDVRSCCNPAHLWLGTCKDNLVDCSVKGRMHQGDDHYTRRHPELRQYGERNNMAKLTEADAIEIKRLYAAGPLLQREIAVIFGITKGHCGDIIRGTRWGHVK
jgi:hypothetical protein